MGMIQNPALDRERMDNILMKEALGQAGQSVTAVGVMKKLIVLLIITTVSAIAFIQFMSSGLIGQSAATFIYIVSIAVTAVLGFVICFYPTLSKYLAPIYAIFEGFTLGLLTLLLETQYHGIGFQAVLLTLFTAFSCLAVYRSGIFKPEVFSPKYAVIAMLAVLFMMLTYIFLGFFNINIGISLDFIDLIITVIALLVYIYVLMCDFRTVGDYIDAELPKEYEWYLAYSILLTLIIIYIEILKLLARSRKK